ncbi:dihydrofolate reductase family protein [Pseudonocardia abyssalis]|uniref:Dihydrofolate reductase family protein n=1 Tax=Pseudonocardia abyssalis TaxID=2792008 RepID=A0ABS6V0C5_9PSEU|nr:dihydrofolate reductase family protein [Pseudonocardia abyssalis]MBW0115122.1 dihydrofolate reductase family protein [Pseudonocardia abyssalis]MBW0137961.1 dihydrofolate reductase family protein [Pseudonocardia abyssalis]
MGQIKVSEFITLDGVIGAPTFTFEYPFTDAMGEAMGRLTSGGSEAILFGRTTWEESGPAWTSRDMADDPGAPFFNDTPKYVVSASRTDADGWAHSSLLGGYDAAALRRFKDGIDGGIYCYGSGTLVRAMLADGLVDELHLWLYPVAVGDGPKLFPEGTRSTLRLGGSESFDNGVVHLTYTP